MRLAGSIDKLPLGILPECNVSVGALLRALLLLGATVALTPHLSAQDAPPANGFVGSKVCQACHPDVWLTFHRNAHFRSHAGKSEPSERTGCESCHGPGRNHVRGAGDKTKIRVFPRLTPGAVLETCLTCHAGDFPRSHIQRSSHTLAGVVCTDCHSIHKSPAPEFLLARKQPDLCYGCHANVRSQFSMSFKHRVNEGSVNCTDCHNPHGIAAPVWRMGQRPRMVDTHLGNEEPCIKCHTDKRGPFAFEHPAVRVDGCETCHSPHGSMNARLLRRPAVFTLCLECHNGAANFGRQANGIKLQSASHDMTDPRYRNCTTCHVRIHGSNSSRLFLR